MTRALILALAACGGAETPPAATPGSALPDAAPAAIAIDASDTGTFPVDGAITTPAAPEVWLRGSTHIHARPSGDSTTPIPEVVAWYESHGYDFVVLTDHNQVSEVDPDRDTTGQVAVRNPPAGLIVLAGIELTHNPSGCVPPGDTSRRCRIHVNLLGTTARPGRKVEWAPRSTHDRVAKYQAALDKRKPLGGIAQLNHAQWFWGMTPDVLVEIASRGIVLYEIANRAFAKWNKGDKTHPSTEALWDSALTRGATLWGVASDDAHDYRGGGKYPAGGNWVVVKARRDPQAILDSLATGRFYSSTGVVLDRAEVVGGELVVEVAPSNAAHVIEFIENGKRVATAKANAARRAVPTNGYVRAVVTRGDGAQAWIQPARR